MFVTDYENYTGNLMTTEITKQSILDFINE